MKKKKKAPTKKPAPIRRHEDWPVRLAAFVSERRHVPFNWVKQNCCFLACDAIRALTGFDPAAKMFRAKVRRSADVARLLKKHGGVEAIAVKVCKECGFQEIPVLMAQRGDTLLLREKDAGPVLGFCDGPHGVFAGLHGLKFVPLADCQRAWRVG